MKDITKEFSDSMLNQDLFQFWEQELSMRNQIRQEPICDFSVDNYEVLYFLLRSFYYSGKRNYFLQIIFANINNSTTLNWLLNCTPEILNEFLQFIPFHIINTRPVPQELQFIITMYKSNYHEHFVRIINVLDLNTCKHLLPRTANPELRRLIKNRQSLLEQQQLKLNYGLFQKNNKYQSFSTLYEDKLKLFIKAAESIQACSVDKFNDSYGSERFSLLLNTVENIFKAGLVEESLAVLIDIYQDYLDKSRIIDINQEEKFHIRCNKLLRKILPLYALISNPIHSYSFTLKFYRQYFDLLSPDAASVHYLNIYQTILETSQGYNKHGIYEIMVKANFIRPFRPDDVFLFTQTEIMNGLKEEKFIKFTRAIRERITSLPHEAFVIMEFLRLLVKQGYKPERQVINNLFTYYIELWKWAPHNIFLHQQILDELGPLLTEKKRHEAIGIITGMKQYSLDQMLNDFNFKPDLFKNRDGMVRLQILTAKFMGVE